MQPDSQTYAPSSNKPQTYPMQSNFGPVQQQFTSKFHNTQGFPSQTSQDQSLLDALRQPGVDLNSPDVFKQNIRIVQDVVARLQSQSKSALAGVQNAYHPGNTPNETTANINALHETIQLLANLMGQTGIGALPLINLPPPSEKSPNVPDEQQLLAETTRGVQYLFEKLKRNQESAAVVSNLLGSDVGAKGGR